MATKGDLVEAQRYSRRRLRTAFTSGIPRGIELEPKNHLRAVVGGVAVAVLMVIGSLLFGYLKPGLAQGWDNNKLLVGSATGARYLSIDGTLHPVANLASAQLLVAAQDYQVMSIDERRVDAAPRGPMVGIVGAPDYLPRPQDLLNTDWNACAVDETIAITVGSADAVTVAPADEAAIVRAGGDVLLLLGSYRYTLPHQETQRTTILRALGLDTAGVVDVSASWVGLFTPGEAIDTWDVPETGTPVSAGSDLAVGDILAFGEFGEGQKYVVTPRGELAPVSEFALILYGHTAASQPQVKTLSEGEVDTLPPADTPLVPAEWPTTTPTALTSATSLCAALSPGPSGDIAPVLAVAAPSGSEAALAGYVTVGRQTVTIPPTGGALVSVQASHGVSPINTDYLIDSLGTAYPIPDVDDDILARLGYTAEDVGQVPPGWIETFTPGPALTVDGARAVVGPAGDEDESEETGSSDDATHPPEG